MVKKVYQLWGQILQKTQHAYNLLGGKNSLMREKIKIVLLRNVKVVLKKRIKQYKTVLIEILFSFTVFPI